jgi:hypothetical protein
MTEPVHTWNYRVIRRELTGDFGYTDVEYAIHAVYYKDGKATAHTSDPAYPVGETLEELRDTLKKMLMALEKPIFDFEKEKV